MYSFSLYNVFQVVKDMVKQRRHCEASIARVYSEYVLGTANISCPQPVSLDTCCQKSRNDRNYNDRYPVVSVLLRQLVRDEYNGMDLDPTTVWKVHKVAKIGGVDFTSGQGLEGVRKGGDKMKRSGSVVTLVRGGRSLYAVVIQFLSFDRLHVTHVRWLPVPDYPTGTPIVVRLVRGNPEPIEPCIVSLRDIDPSKVAILTENDHIYPIRMSGVDTMPTI